MPSEKPSLTVHQALSNLHEQGFVNLDTPIRELVQPSVLNAAGHVGMPTDIIIGPRYVIVTKQGGGAVSQPSLGATIAAHEAGSTHG